MKKETEEANEFLIMCLSKGMTISQALQQMRETKPNLIMTQLDKTTIERLEQVNQKHKQQMKQSDK